MLSEKCSLKGLNGIKTLDRIGPYLVITNRWRHEVGVSKRYVLVNESQLWVHSVHGSRRAAVVFAQKHGHKVLRATISQRGDEAVRRVRQNAAKNARGIMTTALAQWATEGGFIGDVPKFERKKSVFTLRKSE